MALKLNCPYLDQEYAKANEFDYACSNPYYVKLNGNFGSVLSDDLLELCSDCHIFNRINNDNGGVNGKF